MYEQNATLADSSISSIWRRDEDRRGVLLSVSVSACAATAQDGTPIVTDGSLIGFLKEASNPGSIYIYGERERDRLSMTGGAEITASLQEHMHIAIAVRG